MKLITWPVPIILVIAFTWSVIDGANQRSETRAWMRQAAMNDSLHQLSEGRYQRAAVAVDRERDLRSALKDSLPELHRELRRVRAREHAYISTIADLQTIVAQGSATDTVIVTVEGDSIYQVSFMFQQPGIRVEGWTRTPPPVYRIQVEHDPIPLHLVISELRDGSWQTNVETAPWVEISALNTQVLSRRPGWWARNKLWIGVGLGAVMKTLLER